ncbi:hypothetical protein [Brevibacillus choshinensis]|uniref:hypothetical protein n=1 Tax=Brevibacillus choshinensis TaxID=54911 RepID=UPI002E1F8428|nr:hypothetical protein [Brevibacillus choshinensis]
MLILSGNKKWKKFNEVMVDYPSYLVYPAGICSIKPEDIIGLCNWPPEETAADEKMGRLISSVRAKGWYDEHPGDLHLYKIPTGKYTVCSGGDHRSILSNELSIPRINANVDVVIPENLFDQKELLFHNAIENQIRDLENEANEIKMSDPYFEFDSTNIAYDHVFKKIESLHRQQTEILRRECVRLNLHVSYPFRLNLR